MKVAPSRIRPLSRCTTVSSGKPGGIVYWMSRDQRVQDNWALLHARELAVEHKLPLAVIFCLSPTFLGATIRHYGFMTRGLEEVESELRSLEVPFALLPGNPVDVLPKFVEEHDVAAVVTDFSPLRISKTWKSSISEALPAAVPLVEVDAHNVVPVWVASDKQEVGARTIRKKITEKLPKWLVDIPRFDVKGADNGLPPLTKPQAKSIAQATAQPVDWDAVRASLKVDMAVGEIDWCRPGTAAAHVALREFCEQRLKIFADKRNDPNVDACSGLSPYLHFGQLSAQRMALVVKGYNRSHSTGVQAFLEESIVRRELSDNFCFYQPQYDSLEGAAGWARESLELHTTDKREHVYTLEQLEAAQTHEDIWNAAQIQMATTGKMHGFMRMYWAKKILEWSPTPAEALTRANFLNDKYSIDGRDPNGYVGCGWAIMGTHDMGWKEREVFGKIRFMNYNGCKRKFDIKQYADRWTKGAAGTSSAAQASKKQRTG